MLNTEIFIHFRFSWNDLYDDQSAAHFFPIWWLFLLLFRTAVSWWHIHASFDARTKWCKSDFSLSLSSSPAPLLVQMENPLNKIMCLIFRPVQMEFVRPRHYLYAIFFMMLACQWQWVFGIVCGCGLWMALYWCICDIRYVRTHHSTDIDWGPGHCLSWKWNIRILLLFGGWERAQQCCLRVPIY